jgi:hypothetical protein
MICAEDILKRVKRKLRMSKNEKIINEANTNDSTLNCCPHCNSDQVWRIQRTEAEKITYLVSKGEMAIKKYLCHSCRGIIIVHRESIEYGNINANDLENKSISTIPCTVCNFNGLQIGKVLPADEIAYNAATGSTAFRKLTCLNCQNETIVSSEDYQAANKMSFD